MYPILDQRELITTLKKKDPQAFEHLIQRYGSMLHKVASRIVGEDEARDVLQDTWLTVYRNIDSFGGQAALATWLYRIVVNMSLTHLRHRSRSDTIRSDLSRSHFVQATDDSAQTCEQNTPPEDALLRRESARLLRREIDRLPEVYRSVLIASEIHELSHPETAELLDLSISAVKTRVFRARSYLRKSLERYFPGRGSSVSLEEGIAA